MRRQLRKICVFCGSSSGSRPIYQETTRRLGSLLAESGIGLVYGGAHRGLMGILADSTLAAGGEVTGVIPQSLVDLEIAHTGLTELHVVQIHARAEERMADLSDAFIACRADSARSKSSVSADLESIGDPLDKPCGLLNTAGYYDGLIALFQAWGRGSVHPVAHAQVCARQRRSCGTVAIARMHTSRL